MQERLVKAAIYIIRIRLVDIPDEDLRRMFVAIKDDLSFDEPKGKEGRIAATLQETADADASEIARRILELHDRLG
jgi:predicted RNA polymerase sigma factor